MNNCIDHIQCPKCASIGKDKHGDNLAVYSDNSMYCFSCGYYKLPLFKQRYKKSSQCELQRISLPPDIMDTIPERVKCTYLQQYGITDEDLKTHHVMWSNYYQRLYFPIFSPEGLIAYVGRYCGEDSSNPKWYTQGDLKNIIHILGKSGSSTLVLTEDIISAIKVSHLDVKTMPIFGSHISNLTWLRLKLLPNISNIIVWLDRDKRKESLIFAKHGRDYGIPVTCISTSEDPKALSENLIEKYLTIAQKYDTLDI